jgi:2-oxoglutarate/2-oxoacid ferredoxin oxidoreductase subunit alpha
VVQAEDEIAAIGMIVGAGWAGARAMTATSGPGISLMAEFAGLAYFAEIPIVVWDVTRMGPSTGLPTRTSQGDLLFTYFLGHGDSRQIILLPGTRRNVSNSAGKPSIWPMNCRRRSSSSATWISA